MLLEIFELLGTIIVILIGCDDRRVVEPGTGVPAGWDRRSHEYSCLWIPRGALDQISECYESLLNYPGLLQQVLGRVTEKKELRKAHQVGLLAVLRKYILNSSQIAFHVSHHRVQLGHSDLHSSTPPSIATQMPQNIPGSSPPNSCAALTLLQFGLP